MSDFQTQHQVETYKSLITISTDAFKYFALINGGAAVALLSYLAALAKECAARPDFTIAMGCFIAGLLCCGFAQVFSYAAQLRLFRIDAEPGYKEDPPLVCGLLCRLQLVQPGLLRSRLPPRDLCSVAPRAA